MSGVDHSVRHASAAATTHPPEKRKTCTAAKYSNLPQRLLTSTTAKVRPTLDFNQPSRHVPVATDQKVGGSSPFEPARSPGPVVARRYVPTGTGTTRVKQRLTGQPRAVRVQSWTARAWGSQAGHMRVPALGARVANRGIAAPQTPGEPG